MQLKVTLDLYSGRENPTVILKGKAAQDALARLRPTRKLTTDEAKARPLPDSTLGYRGLLIEQVDGVSDALPARVRYSDGDLFAAAPVGRAADESFEAFILPQFNPKLLPKRTVLDTEINRLRALRPTFKLVPFPILKPTCPCAPLYEPTWWNDGGQKQYHNNCYNYGCNYRTDTFAQPGRASGAMYPLPIAAAGVHNGALADALTDSPTGKNECPKEGHLAALVIAPGYDFHWYRRGRMGRWTHKPGGTPVTDRDNAGNLISDPRTANRGPYTVFVGFMVVMHGHIKIN